MSHLDENALHRYLDGEEAPDQIREKNVERHLTACGACRAALEEARALRDRAGEILEGATAPSRATPPFSDLLHRAEAEPVPQPERRAWTVRPLATAATLVLAVAAGWTVRGLLMDGTTVTFSDSVAVGEAIIAAPPARRSEVSPAAADDEQGGATRERQGGGPPTVAEAPSMEGAPAEPETQVVAAETRVRSASGRALDQADIPAPRDLAAPTPAAAITGQMARREIPESWTLATREVARAYLGEDLAEVPGLQILGYATGVWSGALAVRVVQALSDADSLELILTRVVGTDALRAREAAASGAVRLEEAAMPSVVRGQLRIRGRGSLSADSLNVLLGRLEIP